MVVVFVFFSSNMQIHNKYDVIYHIIHMIGHCLTIFFSFIISYIKWKSHINNSDADDNNDNDDVDDK